MSHANGSQKQSRRVLASAAPFIPAILVTIIGYYPVLGTWWFHDDWTFLADAAGLTPPRVDLVRVAFYKLYWWLMYGAFGTNPVPYAVSRLAVHALCASLVVMIGERLRMSWTARVAAGVIFAASPVAFESLYWGTGMVEELCALFGLAAVLVLLRWGRAGLLGSFILTILAVLTKEYCFFLPLVWAGYAWHFKLSRWLVGAGVAVLVFLVALTVDSAAGVLTGSGDYHMVVTSVPRVFFVLGFWLLAPAPLMRGLELHVTALALVGLAIWSAWAWVAWREYRRGQSLLLILLALTILPLLPATLVGDHAVPRYLYGSLGAFSLAVGLLVFNLTETSRWRAVLALTVVGGLYSWTATSYRLDARWSSGTAIHRLVSKQETSHTVFDVLREAIKAGDQPVVFLTPESWPGMTPTLLRDTLGDELGVQLIFGPEHHVRYVRKLNPRDKGAVIVRFQGDGHLSYGYY